MPTFVKEGCCMAQRRGYKFTNKRHSQTGIMSLVFGILSLVSLVLVVYLSYQSAGDVPNGYGVTGFLITVFAIIGVTLAALDLRQRECYKFFPGLGLLLNLCALAGISGILYIASNL